MSAGVMFSAGAACLFSAAAMWALVLLVLALDAARLERRRDLRRAAFAGGIALAAALPVAAVFWGV